MVKVVGGRGVMGLGKDTAMKSWSQERDRLWHQVKAKFPVGAGSIIKL